jgi:hypothetical protein
VYLVSHFHQAVGSQYTIFIGIFSIESFEGFIRQRLASFSGGNVLQIFSYFASAHKSLLRNELLNEFVLLMEHALLVVLFSDSSHVSHGELLGVSSFEIGQQLL